MSEITKLYDNAKIAPKRCSECDNNMDCGFGKDCYSPFTAEKQIELIKWLMKYDEIHGDYNDDEYGFSTLNYSGKYKKDFEESLASVINNELWQSLTEEEKQQVKGILE